MSTSKSVVMFLNNKGGVFNASLGLDPVAALAAAMRKDLRSVRAAVQNLQSEDRIWIRSSAKGNLPPAIGLHSRNHGEDKRPVTAEGKRQDRYARGVPAYLTDDMVGELTVRTIEPPPDADDDEPEGVPDEEVVVTPVAAFSLRGRMPEFLTLALMALRRDSTDCVDCNGHNDFGGCHRLVNANSCVELLVTLLTGLTKEQAAHLNATLGRLGLRHSITVGAGVFRHYVRVDVEEVSAEMFKSEPGSPADTEADELEQFLAYVEGLEKRVAELEPLEGQVARQLSQVTELQRQLREKDEEVERLKRQIGGLEKETDLAARMRGILDRSRSQK